MGHTRLGDLPKTRRWNEIVRLFGRSGEGELTPEDIGKIAHKTMNATRAALLRAMDDPRLHYSFFLLSQVALAGKSGEWRSVLSRAGVDASDAKNVFELSERFHAAVDKHLGLRSSDFGEIAQKAAGEALLAAAHSRPLSLFGTDSDELGDVLKSISTKKGFSDLGQTFFARFMERFLNSYLSRATAGQLGKGSLRQVGDVSEFNSAFQHHCHQTARIVKDFCGDWYSKTSYESGINPENAARFTAVALKKLQAELRHQKAGK